MPQIQTIDTTPRSPDPTGVEKFFSRLQQEYQQRDENQAINNLMNTYKQNKDFEELQFGLETNNNISPSRRLEAQKNLNQIRKGMVERDRLIAKSNEDAMKARQNQTIASDLQRKYNLTPEQAQAYVNNPSALSKVYPNEKRDPLSTQPMDPDQVQKINDIVNLEGFRELTPFEQNLALINGGVSRVNADAIIKPLMEENKPKAERDSTIAKEQAKKDVEFAQKQTALIPEIMAQMKTLKEAIPLVLSGAGGGIIDQVFESLGLLQYTSSGRRELTSVAKDSLKNIGMREMMGGKVSNLEFSFFENSTISPKFSKDANLRIIKKEMLALKYKELYAHTAQRLRDESGGRIPENFQHKVNKEYTKAIEPLNKQLKVLHKEFDLITKVPKDKVLMFNKKGQPVHVPKKEAHKFKNNR